MDVLRLFQDYGIDHLTEGHKHCRDGWVNTPCPFCTGNPGYHLGWNLADEYFRCYRCGWKPPMKAISMLLNTTASETYNIIKLYGTVLSYVNTKPKDKKEFVLPSNLTKLKERHRKYLEDRNFDPDKIRKIWGVKGTGPVSSIENLDYRFSIIIPFKWNGEVVSFDSRDITDHRENKYQACPAEREIIEHKKILYGNQEAWGDVGICVEGPTDVWRLGEKACAVSGIQYKQEQVKQLANAFKKVAVVFDDESQARKQARKLVKDLQFRNVDAYRVIIKGDPGSMSSDDANKLMKNILNK